MITSLGNLSGDRIPASKYTPKEVDAMTDHVIVRSGRYAGHRAEIIGINKRGIMTVRTEYGFPVMGPPSMFIPVAASVQASEPIAPAVVVEVPAVEVPIVEEAAPEPVVPAELLEAPAEEIKAVKKPKKAAKKSVDD